MSRRTCPVLEAMTRKAALVEEVVACLERGGGAEIGPLMSRDFDLRRSVYTLSPQNLRMIEIAREGGAHANFSGSGGAAVATYASDRQYDELEKAYSKEGYKLIKVRVAAASAAAAGRP